MSSVLLPEHRDLPVRSQTLGPVTAARMRRAGLVYVALFAVGLLINFSASSSGWQAFGLGLAYPGGGFLHYLHGGTLGIVLHLLCFAATLVLFVVSLALWFGTGNQAAPIVVWLGAALLAAAMGHAHTLAGSWALVVLCAVLTGASGALLFQRAAFKKAARREQRNAHIGTWQAVSTVTTDDAVTPQVNELGEEDLAALRYALDRALQPVDEFAGFDFIEQFQPSAVRYQINNLGYVLSLANYTHLPAMHGYLKQAQENLIEKKKQHRVWKYWAIESLWGNFRNEPDPIARDNVMYSGWYGAQIGIYAAATGDRRYEQPGAITLRAENGSEYVHDFPSIVNTLINNEQQSEFCLFPCEPNWIYPLCNNQGTVAIRAFDQLNGTNRWESIRERYRQRLEEEFIDVDGHFVLLRSTRTGFTIPGLSSSKEDAIFAFWMHAVFPDLAIRAWEIARGELFEPSSTGLTLRPIKPWLDPGNYKFNTAYALGALGMAAQELGDDEALSAVTEAIEALETNRDGGVLSYPGCSNWSHAFLLKTRVGRTNGMSDLVNLGLPEKWRNGPVINQLPYPEVLPARAVSDGEALEAVLYPGAAAGQFKIGLAGLRPGQRYRLNNKDINTAADDKGELNFEIEIIGRTEVHLTPAV